MSPHPTTTDRRTFLSLSAAAATLLAGCGTDSTPMPTATTTSENTMELRPVSPTAKAPAERFTGDVYVTMINTPQPPSRLVASAVKFTPGARTNWHSHANGQTLHVTEGVGLVVNRDGQTIRMRAGDTVWTPPGEEHWHGGTADNLMCHLALLEGTDQGDGTTWLEPVTDAQYDAANQA